jgi:hypothetical protein
MTPEQIFELACAQRALSDADGCLMQRAKEWSIDDEIAVAMIERARATVH